MMLAMPAAAPGEPMRTSAGATPVWSRISVLPLTVKACVESRSPTSSEPTVRLASSVIVAAAEILVLMFTTSPAVVPGTAAGFQFAAVPQPPPAPSTQSPLAARTEVAPKPARNVRMLDVRTRARRRAAAQEVLVFMLGRWNDCETTVDLE
jgi:hypothetical protein